MILLLVKDGHQIAMADLLQRRVDTPPVVLDKHSFTLQLMQEQTLAVYQELLDASSK